MVLTELALLAVVVIGFVLLPWWLSVPLGVVLWAAFEQAEMDRYGSGGNGPVVRDRQLDRNRGEH